MKCYQFGNAESLLLIVLCVVLVTWGLYDMEQAPSADLKSVIDSAQGNEQAEAALKQALTEHPAPSRSQLRRIQEIVDVIITRDLSATVTGHDPATLEVERPKSQPQQSPNPLHLRIKLVLSVLAFGFASFMLFKFARRMRGPA